LILKHLILAVVCLQTACVPLAHHGPWVREGLSGDLLTGAALVREQAAGDFGFALGVDVGARYGIVPADSNSTAASLGLQLPLLPFLIGASEANAEFAELISGDVYLTGLKTEKIVTSIGFTASRYHRLPYIQIGSRTLEDGSWYTTQAFLISDDDFQLWLPSFTWVGAVREEAAHVLCHAGSGSRYGKRGSSLHAHAGYHARVPSSRCESEVTVADHRG
jgi:hypothetical protein